MKGLYGRVYVDANGPKCFHGPKLLFERIDGKSPSYRCSAFPNAKACPKDEQASLSHVTTATTTVLASSPRKNRCFCFTCQILFDRSQSHKLHAGHRIRSGLTKNILQMPSYLLEPLEANAEHAQYFFSEETLNFIMKTIQKLRVENIICVGAPRLFDFVRQKVNQLDLPIRAFLLDLDRRLTQFYSANDFAQFNMLNGYYFKTEMKEANSFIEACQNLRILLFCDPPFAAMMEPLMATLSGLKNELNAKKPDNVITMVTLPYFLGRKLFQAAPSMKMLDYKVTYEKHVRLTSSGVEHNDSSQVASIPVGKRRISIVRFFTDAPLKEIPPPDNMLDNFWFCEICQRYSDVKNRHCDACKACTTMHGETYVHCILCGHCRPPIYSHCKVCNKCVQQSPDRPLHACDVPRIANKPNKPGRVVGQHQQKRRKMCKQ